MGNQEFPAETGRIATSWVEREAADMDIAAFTREMRQENPTLSPVCGKKYQVKDPPPTNPVWMTIRRAKISDDFSLRSRIVFGRKRLDIESLPSRDKDR